MMMGSQVDMRIVHLRAPSDPPVTQVSAERFACVHNLQDFDRGLLVSVVCGTHLFLCLHQSGRFIQRRGSTRHHTSRRAAFLTAAEAVTLFVSEAMLDKPPKRTRAVGASV